MNSLFHRLTHSEQGTVQRLHPYPNRGDNHVHDLHRTPLESWDENSSTSHQPPLSQSPIHVHRTDSESVSPTTESLRKSETIVPPQVSSNQITSSTKTEIPVERRDSKPLLSVPNVAPRTSAALDKASPLLVPLNDQQETEFLQSTSLHARPSDVEDTFSMTQTPTLQVFKDKFQHGPIESEPGKSALRLTALSSAQKLFPLTSDEAKDDIIPSPSVIRMPQHRDTFQKSISSPTLPEINIHIGRIEVTAVGAPQTEKPSRKPRAQSTVSLEEYLKKQQKAGS
jgi:hypothetical protein